MANFSNSVEDSVALSTTASVRIRGSASASAAGVLESPGIVREAMDRALRSEERSGSYCLSVIDELAREGSVEAVTISGLWWMRCPPPRTSRNSERVWPGSGIAAG